MNKKWVCVTSNFLHADVLGSKTVNHKVGVGGGGPYVTMSLHNDLFSDCSLQYETYNG